ncbi:MAG: NAD(P)-dependent oxidoreductase [Pseudobdellovibrionaceae bacterium]
MNLDRKNILITDRFTPEALITLNQQKFFQVEKTLTPDLAQTDLSSTHGLIIRSKTHITKVIFARAKKLQVIITATSGFDHIDLEEAKKWGVTVMHTPAANVESATQLTWSLVLACSHRLRDNLQATKTGEWNRDLLVGHELYGKTYGIVGLGRIGSRVAEIAQAFGMKVIAFDPYIEDGMYREVGAERVAYEELLKRSDVLSFHVPKTSETLKMLNRSHFEYINRGIILVNTSRGGVISEMDLFEALEQGWVGACGLDVYEKEPLPKDHRLFKFAQVVGTAHVGANTHEAFAKASEQAALKMIRFFVDGTTSDTLPPKATWYGAVPPWKTSE